MFRKVLHSLNPLLGARLGWALLRGSPKGLVHVSQDTRGHLSHIPSLLGLVLVADMILTSEMLLSCPAKTPDLCLSLSESGKHGPFGTLQQNLVGTIRSPVFGVVRAAESCRPWCPAQRAQQDSISLCAWWCGQSHAWAPNGRTSPGNWLSSRPAPR